MKALTFHSKRNPGGGAGLCKKENLWNNTSAPNFMKRKDNCSQWLTFATSQKYVAEGLAIISSMKVEFIPSDLGRWFSATVSAIQSERSNLTVN